MPPSPKKATDEHNQFMTSTFPSGSAFSGAFYSKLFCIKVFIAIAPLVFQSRRPFQRTLKLFLLNDNFLVFLTFTAFLFSANTYTWVNWRLLHISSIPCFSLYYIHLYVYTERNDCRHPHILYINTSSLRCSCLTESSRKKPYHNLWSVLLSLEFFHLWEHSWTEWKLSHIVYIHGIFLQYVFFHVF